MYKTLRVLTKELHKPKVVIRELFSSDKQTNKSIISTFVLTSSHIHGFAIHKDLLHRLNQAGVQYENALLFYFFKPSPTQV